MGSDTLREILGRKRTLEILKFLSEYEVQNYSDIEEAIDTSTDTLSQSLKLLEESELIDRNEESKKNVQYRVTDKGVEFLEAINQVEEILEE
jgi:DNA-binding HxlR family transcriptional regulator